MHVFVARDKSSTRPRKAFRAVQLQAFPKAIEIQGSIVGSLPCVSPDNVTVDKQGYVDMFMRRAQSTLGIGTRQSVWVSTERPG